MFLALISLSTALIAGQHSQSMGAAEGLRPLPASTQEASASAPAPATTPQAAVAPAPRQVCRNIEVTGSRFPIRQCHSTVQTDAEREEAREMLRRMQGARTPPVG